MRLKKLLKGSFFYIVCTLFGKNGGKSPFTVHMERLLPPVKTGDAVSVQGSSAPSGAIRLNRQLDIWPEQADSMTCLTSSRHEGDT